MFAIQCFILSNSNVSLLFCDRVSVRTVSHRVSTRVASCLLTVAGIRHGVSCMAFGTGIRMRRMRDVFMRGPVRDGFCLKTRMDNNH